MEPRMAFLLQATNSQFLHIGYTSDPSSALFLFPLWTQAVFHKAETCNCGCDDPTDGLTGTGWNGATQALPLIRALPF